MTSVRSNFAFILVLLVAAGLRFSGLTFDSFWLDEAYQTMVDATGAVLPDFINPASQPFLFELGPPRDLATLLLHFREVDPLCPPLYPVLLNRWMAVFGSADMTVRLLSCLFSLTSIIAVYALAGSAVGRRAALFACLLQAISPFDIHYAQEARMYSLVVLTSSISCLTLLHVIKQFQKTAVSPFKTTLCMLAYVASTWAVINSHYTGLFLVGFQGLYGIFYCLVRRNWRLMVCLSAGWAGVLLLWLPWFEMFRQAAALRTASFYVAREPSFWWPLIALTGYMPINWIVFLAGKRVMVYAIPLYFTSALMLILGAVASFANLSNSDSGKVDKRYPPLYLWSWLIVPAAALWAVDVLENHKVIEMARYLIYTAPAAYILAGVGLSRFWLQINWIRWVLVAHVVFALANYAYAHVIPQREPWRQMAATVEKLCGEDLILVSQHYDIVCLNRYLTRPITQLGVSPNLGQAHFDSVLNGRDRFWLLTAQEGEAATGLIPQRFKQTKRIDMHHGLHLRLYEE